MGESRKAEAAEGKKQSGYIAGWNGVGGIVGDRGRKGRAMSR